MLSTEFDDQTSPERGKTAIEDIGRSPRWKQARSAGAADRGAVTVVVPVYGSLNETLACLLSVLTAASSVAFHLLVIDDCSPDPSIYPSLEDVSDNGRLFSVWRNERNCGFVRTANRGLLETSGDVVLLNSDTLVTDHWLDRLVATARADPSVASVSPMSNNATILSYPRMNHDNALPDGLILEEMSALFGLNRERLPPVEVPVTVGFCMLVTRAAIEATGGLDEALFGIGYGEESDWCMRAAALGYKHVVAIDAFVFHIGSISFSAKSVRRQELAAQALAQRHPGYWPAVGHFCAADPLKAARRLVDVRRLQRAASRCDGIILHVLHALGGGTQVHAYNLADLLEEHGYGSIFLRPDSVGRLVIDSRLADVPNLIFDCVHDLDVLRDLIDGIEVERLHVHALIGFSPEAASFVESIEASSIVTLHDYVPLCPQIVLLDHTGRYCDLPPATHCNRCLAARRPPVPADSIEVWRRDWGKLLKRADRIVAPSHFVERTFHRVHPELEIEVVTHHEAARMAPLTTPSANGDARNRPRHVAVLGNLNHHKGIDVVAACAQYARDLEQPLQFLVFGGLSVLDEAHFGGKLRTMGAYARDTLPELMANERCSIGFLPSIWPETYSYVLSEMLDLGLHTVVFDLGAQADRLRATGTGTILPIGLGAGGINAALLGLELEEAADAAAAERRESASDSSAYLERLYGRSFGPSSTAS